MLELLLLLNVVTLQIIEVPETTPCFMNFSAGASIWKNCGMGEDYLESALLGWEWVTGGFFSLILVSLFIMISYIKYHKAVYPLLIGLIFLPFSFFLFPDVFLTFGFIMMIVTTTILVWYIYIKQTKEY